MSEDIKDNSNNESVLNEPTDTSSKDTTGQVEDKNIDNSTQENKKNKKKRRRRNYDDYDAEIDKEEQKFKKLNNNNNNSVSNTKIGSNINLDELSDSDIDDEKLDQLLENDLDNDVEDDLAEIDTSNIISSGRRTRGKIIDYKKTAEKLDSIKTNPILKDTPSSSSTNKEKEEEEDDDEEDADFKI